MDDDQAPCPATPGADPPAPVVRVTGHAARHDGPGGAPLRPEGLPGASGEERYVRGLAVAVVDEAPVRIVTVVGDLDHDTGDQLRAALARPVGDGIERILVDLGDLRFCDSTGLHNLIRAGAPGPG
ncbi:STAS domain-containing protein [Kitasatospora sp. NPDC097691]|uniref:STAS domain-containing protein n=1 Tax=Kitasatospora sp. NPDC097691 TaxID=3157231 RepID=UPI0033240586